MKHLIVPSMCVMCFKLVCALSSVTPASGDWYRRSDGGRGGSAGGVMNGGDPHRRVGSRRFSTDTLDQRASDPVDGFRFPEGTVKLTAVFTFLGWTLAVVFDSSLLFCWRFMVMSHQQLV